MDEGLQDEIDVLNSLRQRRNTMRNIRFDPTSLRESNRNRTARWLHCNGTSQLHWAVTGDSVSILESSLASGYENISRRNLEGQTALVKALCYGKHRIAQYLLSYEANILSIDNQGKKQRDSTTELQEDKLDSCLVNQLILTNNSDVLAQTLDQLTSISSRESEVLVERALELDCKENLRVLLKRGPGSAVRRRLFFSRVTLDLDDPKIRPYFEKLVEWQVIDRDMLSPSVWSLRCERPDLYDALLKIGVVQYARRNFALELIAQHFCFKRANTHDEWRKYQFNVNGLDLLDFGALHWACIMQSARGVSYLLDYGADPNLRGRQGQTPLYHTTKEVLVQLLIEAGADVQLRDYNGCTLLDIEPYNDYIAAHVGILAKKGLLRDDVTLTDRYGCVKLQSQLDFKQLKTVQVSEDGATLYSVLFDSANKTSRYVKDQETVDAILKASTSCQISLKSYRTMLAKRLKDALEVHNFRPIAAGFLSREMNISDPNHLVVAQIVGYLSYEDLRVVFKLERQIMSTMYTY